MKHSDLMKLRCLALVLAVAGACDTGSKSRTKDEIAADSELAADLALANRDTLLIDSIGQYRPAQRPADSGMTAPSPARPSTGTVAPAAPAPSPRPSAPPPAAVPKSPSRAAPLSPSSSSRSRTTSTRSSAAARRKSRDPCDSPLLRDQQACVHETLADADKRLNGIYRSLITEMRHREGVTAGRKDPPSVERLRVAQRAWLLDRDTECRRRGRGKEGALWARPRVECLREFSTRRANELADNFSRLTAR
jgi:uncharacterized protein YecT (DUF1311 family)